MRRALRLGGIFLLVLLLLGVAAIFWVDSIARYAVEKGASRGLGVETTLASLRIGLFPGQANLKELLVKNPVGFPGPYFLRLGAGEAIVSLDSLLSDRVVISRVFLRGVDLSLEQSASATNLGVILDNLQRVGGNAFSAPDPSSSELRSEPPGKRFVIEEILIESIRVGGTFFLPGVGTKTVSYQVPEIRLRNVGSDSAEGASLARLSAEIVGAILKGAIEEGRDLPKEMTQEWKTKSAALREKLREQTKDLKEKAEELKELFRKKKD